MGVFYIFLGVAVLFLLYKWLFEGKLGPALFEWDSSKITFLFEKSGSGTELVLRRGEIFPKKFNIPLGNDTPEHYSLFVAEKDIAQFLSNNHQGYGTVVAAKLLEVQKWKKMLIRVPILSDTEEEQENLKQEICKEHDAAVEDFLQTLRKVYRIFAMPQGASAPILNPLQDVSSDLAFVRENRDLFDGSGFMQRSHALRLAGVAYELGLVSNAAYEDLTYSSQDKSDHEQVYFGAAPQILRCVDDLHLAEQFQKRRKPTGYHWKFPTYSNLNDDYDIQGWDSLDMVSHDIRSNPQHRKLMREK